VLGNVPVAATSWCCCSVPFVESLVSWSILQAKGVVDSYFPQTYRCCSFWHVPMYFIMPVIAAIPTTSLAVERGRGVVWVPSQAKLPPLQGLLVTKLHITQRHTVPHYAKAAQVIITHHQDPSPEQNYAKVAGHANLKSTCSLPVMAARPSLNAVDMRCHSRYKHCQLHQRKLQTCDALKPAFAQHSCI